LIVCASYRKALQEESKPNSESVIFRLYVIVVGIYAGVQFFISFFMRIPACHRLTNQCDRWPLIRFVKWMRQVLFLVFFFLPFLKIYYYYFLYLDAFVLFPSFVEFLHVDSFVVCLFYQRSGIMLDAACMRVLLILSSNL
jgi:callose synthase